MTALSWRRAVRADLPALADFLRRREEGCAGFVGRLLRDGQLRLPSPLRGAVWIADGTWGIHGAVLHHPSRIAYPCLPAQADGDGGLALVAGSWRAASAIGMAAGVERYEAAFGLSPEVSVAYRLMAREPGYPASRVAERDALRDGRLAPEILVRMSRLSDLDAIFPLQEAYEREEVLTQVHEFQPAACRAALASAIERQLVLVALRDGRIVAKAGMNARGFGVDQVGGVFTEPELRGRGIARELMIALLAEIEGQGKRAVLFVKPANAPAISLYRSLGFAEIGDFKADYFPE
ncbi:MAG: GNAT family N-acetyltransferase [Spirochaetaceae bacterium]|nr:GNAT family N-acetyltransferase [Spirochaetaceae bacterium]